VLQVESEDMDAPAGFSTQPQLEVIGTLKIFLVCPNNLLQFQSPRRYPGTPRDW
jgi:hypothetical protein